MNRQVSDEELLATLRSLIADALSVDPTKINPETRLFGDLQAESIDILDVRFRIEHEFGIRIDQNDLMQRLGQHLTSEEVVERFTVAYLADYVRKKLP